MFHNANSVAKVTDFSFKKSFYIGLLREIGRLVNVNVYITVLYTFYQMKSGNNIIHLCFSFLSY